MILIVEDELVQLTMVAKLLKSADYDVMEARDGMTAISVARKELPDLVLLDLGLPLGDGFHVMERLQLLSYTAKIPVIVLSSRNPEEAEEPSRLAGAVAYLQKPVNAAKLLRVMAATFGNLAMAARYVTQSGPPPWRPGKDKFGNGRSSRFTS